jgi:Na+:H+ antiporter, NhaA family
MMRGVAHPPLPPQPYPLEALFGRIRSPFEQFLRRTTAGGIVLVATTALALALASAFGHDAFAAIWERRWIIGGDRFALDLTRQQWVNDALMALFFLVVGLELKREMLVGELSSIRDAALPVLAAVGGMAVPAGIYAAFNAGTPGAAGWGIPMATDIAFAVGILVLLAWRVPKNLIVFLTALAIADDLGAVLVIAVFYSHGLDLHALGIAAGLLVVLVLFNRAGIRHPVPYGVVGVLLWIAVHASGVHATLAGILLASTIPARPRHTPAEFEQRMDELMRAHRDGACDVPTVADAVENSARAVQSPLQRIQDRLSPWVTFAVLPIFAFANAGIDLSEVRWGEALSHRITLGVLVGLALGKFVGISIFSWVGVRLGLGRLPAGVEWRHLLGAAWLGGIGFTMSLFIAQLAFREPQAVEEAKLGIVLASLVSAVVGLVWLYATGARRLAPAARVG